MFSEVNQRSTVARGQGGGRLQAGEVHVTTAAEKEEFRKASQASVMEYIVEQVGQDLVDQLLAAVEDSKRLVRGF